MSTLPGAARKPLEAAARRVNLSLRERWTSALAGAGFVAFGLTRRHAIPGAALTMIGAGLLWRGLTGHSDIYGILGVDNSAGKRPAGELLDPTLRRPP
ncbi:MAG: DUF2892 domain-containing protein [Acidobacteriota bacterium]|nr:DUF2892 domain-containing protein [Acidobacteriota bacterium]